MKIIFDFGEHFYASNDSSTWLQFILSIFGAFLGFGSALFIYYKSVKRETLEQEKRQKFENRNKLKYNKLLIDNLIVITKKQIEWLDRFKAEQETDLLNIKFPRQLTTNDFKRLILINKDIFDSFNYYDNEENDWIENLKNMHTTIDHIEGTFLEIKRITSNHLSSNYKKASEIKQKIELISDKLSSFAFSLRGQLGETRREHEIYNFIDAKVMQYSIMVESKPDFNRINAEYLEPLLTDILNHFPNESSFYEIIFLAKNARVKMNDIKFDVENFMVQLDIVKGELEKSLAKVENSMNVLNNV